MQLDPIHSGHKWLNQTELPKYNALDCVATALLARALTQEMGEHGMDGYWREVVWPLVPAVRAMQRMGLGVDVGAKTQLRRKVRRQLAEVDELILAADPSGKLRQPTPKYPNSLGSGPKVANFLFRELGLKPTKFTEKGKESVDQEALIRVWRDLRKKDEHARPVVENLFHRSRLQTIDERYLDFHIHQDGRVRPSVKMIGTETLRFAYSGPPLQQAPPDVRPIFVPAPGCVLLSLDYSQLEARIQTYLAWVAKDLRILESGQDLHKLTAQEIFDISPEQWEDLEPSQQLGMRNYAKSFRYRLAYGGDPTQVGALGTKNFCPCPRCAHLAPPMVNLPPGSITKAGQRFLAGRPEVLRFREELLREVRDTKAITLLGRRRYFWGPVSSIKREVFNFPMQFIAAHRINQAMREAHERWQAPVILQNHDCLVLEVPAHEAPEWEARMRSVMESPFRLREGGSEVSFPVDSKTEERWGQK